MTDKPDYYARYDAMGEDAVREKLGLGHISGSGILPAQEWLRQKEAERSEAERVARDALSAEDRRTARSAKNAAWAAAIAAIIAAAAAIASAVIAYRAIP